MLLNKLTCLYVFSGFEGQHGLYKAIMEDPASRTLFRSAWSLPSAFCLISLKPLEQRHWSTTGRSEQASLQLLWPPHMRIVFVASGFWHRKEVIILFIEGQRSKAFLLVIDVMSSAICPVFLLIGLGLGRNGDVLQSPTVFVAHLAQHRLQGAIRQSIVGPLVTFHEHHILVAFPWIGLPAHSTSNIEL